MKNHYYKWFQIKIKTLTFAWFLLVPLLNPANGVHLSTNQEQDYNEIVKIHTEWYKYLYLKLAKTSRYVNSEKDWNYLKWDSAVVSVKCNPVSSSDQLDCERQHKSEHCSCRSIPTYRASILQALTARINTLVPDIQPTNQISLYHMYSN